MGSLDFERFMRAARELIVTETARDQQRTIGPSDMADPCLKCLGRKMAGDQPEREFSMFPWLGTAMHTLIEKLATVVMRPIPGKNDMAMEMFGPDSGAVFELKVFICTIPGYGDIYGSLDVITKEVIGDWKSTSKKKVKVYKIQGPPPSYLGQLTMYLHGARLSGYDRSTGVLVFIPRDAFGVDDLWGYEWEYNPDLAQQIIDRVTSVYQWVQLGRHHELPSDSSCNTCHPGFFG